MRRGLIFVLSSCLLAGLGGATGACRDAGPAPRRTADIVLPHDGRRVEGTVEPGRHVRRSAPSAPGGARRSPGVPRRRRAGVQLPQAARPPRVFADPGPGLPRPRADLPHRSRSLPAGASRRRGRRVGRFGAVHHRVRELPPRGRAGRHPRRRSIAITRRSSPRSSGPARTSAWRSGSPSCSAATSISIATCSRATSSKSCSSRCCGTGRASATATSSRRGSPTTGGC